MGQFRVGHQFGMVPQLYVEFSNDSISEHSPFLTMDSPHNLLSTINVSQYNQALWDLITNLKTQAAKGGPLQKYATGVANVTFFWKIFGLVQCTPELNEKSCSNCLERAANEIPICCAGKDGGRVVMPSCNLRYESGQFYAPTTDALLPATTPSGTATSAPISSNSSPNSTTGRTGGGGNTTRTAIIIVVPTVSVILAILICFLFKEEKAMEKTSRPE